MNTIDFLTLDIVSIFIVSYCEDIWDLYYKAEFEGLNGLLYISITGLYIIHSSHN